MSDTKPKVRIGLAYERKTYEFRGDGIYQSLRPAMSGDAELLQRALLAVRPTFTSRVLRALRPF